MANLRADNLTGTGGRNALDGSVFFDGNYDSLAIPSIALGSGDWTIEFWFYSTKEGSQDGHIYDGRGTGSASSAYPIIKFDTDEKLSFYTTGAIRIQGSSVVELGSWNHVAIVKNSSTTTLYLNGQSEGTYSDSNTYLAPSNSIGRIGTDDNGSAYYFYGFLSNYRFVTGTAVYTAAFTPPTEKLTAIDGTVLLCCQDSDDATQEATGKTITGYGGLASVGVNENLVTNGYFTTGTTGWDDSLAPSETTLTSENQRLKIVASGGTGRARQEVTGLTIGNRYKFQVRHVSCNSGNCFTHLGTSSGGAEYVANLGIGDEDLHTFYFTATATSAWIQIGITIGLTGYFDDVSITLAESPKALKVLPPVGVDEGVVFDGDIKMNSQGYMYFPTGDTAQRGRGRAVMGGFYEGPNTYYTNIEYLSIQSLGNSIKFGDLTLARVEIAACSSSTRALFAGGAVPGGGTGGTKQNIIDYVTIATTANAINFGDLTDTIRTLGGCSNETRGIFGGGIDDPARLATIDYVTIATLGDGADFGDLTEARRNVSAHSSTTRGIFAGGLNPGPAYVNTIDYITIATTGDATNFGDLTALVYATTSCSNSTRGVIMGGTNPSGATNVIDYVTIASTGDAVDFGDITVARSDGAGVASPTRGLMVGGETPSDDFNTIDYVTIATTGNASDFGDASVGVARGQAGSSDCHGGLS